MGPTPLRCNYTIVLLLAVRATVDGSTHGPVTITLRMPEVTITDSQGRHIVISPEQAGIVSSKMGDIAYWIHDCKGG